MPLCSRCKRGYVVWPAVFLFGVVGAVVVLRIIAWLIGT